MRHYRVCEILVEHTERSLESTYAVNFYLQPSSKTRVPTIFLSRVNLLLYSIHKRGPDLKTNGAHWRRKQTESWGGGARARPYQKS